LVTVQDGGALRSGTGESLTLTTNNAFVFQGSPDLNNLSLGTGPVSLASANSSFIVGGTVTIGGAISGTGTSILLDNQGTLILTGNSTYTHTTQLQGGVLVVNGSLASAVTAAGMVAGTGTINGATTVGIDGQLAPGATDGAGTGLLTFGSTLTLGGRNMNSVFEINGTTRGTGYDAVNVAGLTTYGGRLNLVFGSTIPDGTTLDLFGLTGGSAGSFNFVTGSGTYPGNFTNNGGVWTLFSGGQTLTFTQSTGDLVFGLAAVPEPATCAALAGLAALGLAATRRRRFTAR
jgi:autotransporter-associated beta strand protein